MRVEWEFISPQEVFNIAAIQRELIIAVTKAIDEAEKYYKDVTDTWDHDPDLERESGMSGNDYYDQVGSDDDPLFFLDEGTTIRYATMTPDFEPKTEPRRLSSVPGRGGVAYINPHIPRPGIEARFFTEEIEEIVKPKLESNIDIAIDRAT
jgi:hypothetical protein